MALQARAAIGSRSGVVVAAALLLPVLGGASPRAHPVPPAPGAQSARAERVPPALGGASPRAKRVPLTLGGTSARAERVPLALATAIAGDPFVQQSPKLTGGEEIGGGFLGLSVALSADGDTALIGGDGDNGEAGAAWVFTRTGTTWTQQGPKLIPSGESAHGQFGRSVALSGDGDTALIGGRNDNGEVGAAWVFTRTGTTWTQQGPKLTGGEEIGDGQFGAGVALAGDGDTALIGGPIDNGEAGAAWVFTRTGTTWTHEGRKLTPGGGIVHGLFGAVVALSGDGNTALIGAPEDHGGAGAAWAFTRTGSTWTQQGLRLTGGEESTGGDFGWSVALSGDGNTALIGGPFDGNGVGAAWAFTRAGSTWTQQGPKLTGGGESASGLFGVDVALSGDGATALIGGPFDNGEAGAAWAFARTGSAWAQQGPKLTGTGEIGGGLFGYGVALSGDGDSALIGGPEDNGEAGAAWAFASVHPRECTDSWTNTAGGSWFTAANWSRGAPPGPSEDACITASGTYTVTMTQTGATGPVSLHSLTLGGSSGTQTLAVASSCSLNAVLATAAGLSNGAGGAIALTNGDACGDGVTLEGPIANGGGIAAEPANGGFRQLRGSIANTGTLAIETNTVDNAASTQLTNQGAIDVAEGVHLTVSNGSAVANKTGGEISGTGSGGVLMNAGTSFAEGAGTTSGVKPVVIDGGKLSYIGVGASAIALRGSSSLSGTSAAGQSLSIQSTCSEEAAATATAGFTNGGTIALTNGDGCAGDAAIAVPAGRLNNRGTIITEPDHGGARQIQGDVTNSGGTLAIDANTAYNGAGAQLTNDGTIDVAAGTTLSITGAATVTNGSGGTIAGAGTGALVQTGGTFNEGPGRTIGGEPVILDDLTLNYTEHGSGPIDLRGASALNGTVRSGETLSIQSTCGENAVAKTTGSIANGGTIELTNADSCANNATLSLHGGTLTNNGQLNVEDLHGGIRSVEGKLVNNLTVVLAAGEKLHVSETYAQTSAGKLKTLIAGTSDFGSMSVGGTATLAGALIVQQTPPFRGSLGQQFPILTSASLSGTFATETADQINATGLYYKPRYSATEAKLLVTQATLSLSASSGPPGSSVTLTGSGYLPGDLIQPRFTDHAGVKTTFPSATVDAAGEFSTKLTIPASAAAHGGTIAVTSAQTGVHIGLEFRVT